tara:strand:- start:778 stop:1464 length:687 start_codon:yes stop_codon:yes gene_type:complete
MKQKLKYLFGFFILILTIELNAQTTQMVNNDNTIDRDFVATSAFKKKILEQRITEKEINLFLEKNTDSLYSIYLVNKTSDSILISTQDWHLYLIQEAKDQNGDWKPIEYWEYSNCGNSYLTEKLGPNGILKTESLVYSGLLETEIRFKLLNNNQIYYSNSIIGFINDSQFSVPKNITDNRRYVIANHFGGSELANKILFLEPNGTKELAEKHDAYLKRMAELREKNRN